MKRAFIPAFNYNFLSPFYDWLAYLFFWRRQKNKIVNLLKLGPNEKLIDLGCGTGSLLIATKQRYPHNEITGIDIDPTILKIARNKIARNNLKVRLINAGADKLPLQSSSVDVVVSTLVFHHLPLEIKKSALKEIYRVLKRNGRFLLIDFGKAETIVVKTLYRIEILCGIPEAVTMKDCVEGKLPNLLRKVRFKTKEIAPRYMGVHFLLSTK